MFKRAVTLCSLLLFTLLLAATTTTAFAAPGAPAAPAPVDGVDYHSIDTPDEPSGDKVEVTEVFGYGCPHCNALQPYLSTWKNKLPADVHFSYLPAAFEGGPPHCWDEFARAFFAAQAMGVLEKSHDAVYKEVWDQHRFKTCTDIPALYAGFGIDPKVFASTMLSFAVSARVHAAHEQMIRWGIDGTPNVVVDGKYRVDGLVPGGPEHMFQTIDWLIARQRPQHAKH